MQLSDVYDNYYYRNISLVHCILYPVCSQWMTESYVGDNVVLAWGRREGGRGREGERVATTWIDQPPRSACLCHAGWLGWWLVKV